MKRTVVLSLLVIVFAGGCRTTLEPEKPTESYLPWNKEPEASFIQIPVNLEISTIENLVNKNLNGVLFENPSIKTGDESTIALKVWKAGRIRLAMEGNTLEWEMPLKINAQTRMRIGIGSLGFTDTRDLNGELSLKFKTLLEITPDWSVKTKSTPVDYTWIKEPSLTAAGREFPITLLANIILNNTQGSLAQSLDESIQQNLSLRKEADMLWQKLQDPVKIYDHPEVWLILKPEEAYAMQPMATKGVLQWKAALKARIEASVGSRPVLGSLSPLKKINLQVPQAPYSFLFARISANLDSLASTAMLYLKNEKFSSGGRSVVIKELRLFGSEGKLVAETRVEGSINGKLYFTGKPYYNPETRQVSLQDFDFELKTRNLLHKSAAWLLQSTIKKQVAQRLCFDLDSQIDALQQGIDEWTENFEPAEGIKIKGKVENLEPNAIHIAHDALIIYLKASGNIEIISRPIAAAK
ncbi:MAG: hypothetical protein PWR20_742 [Bacteroidales bacterium]|jgi:hypothetical protein|nr:hypothetical protein [Bacteroidales bacterium]MDN5329190.1 hypothetical protein [Bacteroidales bacterium]